MWAPSTTSTSWELLAGHSWCRHSHAFPPQNIPYNTAIFYHNTLTPYPTGCFFLYINVNIFTCNFFFSFNHLSKLSTRMLALTGTRLRGKAVSGLGLASHFCSASLLPKSPAVQSTVQHTVTCSAEYSATYSHLQCRVQ